MLSHLLAAFTDGPFVGFMAMGAVVVGILVACVVIMAVMAKKGKATEAIGTESAEMPEDAAATVATEEAEETEEPETVAQESEEAEEEPVEETEPVAEEAEEEIAEETEPAAEEAEEELVEETETVAEEVTEEEALSDDEEDEDESENGGFVHGKVYSAQELPDSLLHIMGVPKDDKSYRISYQYSFLSRLILASPETQEMYRDFIVEASCYGKLKLKQSRRHQLLTIGRDRAAVIFFKGKKLCVAFALTGEEIDYERYKAEDISAVKRFEATPAMIRYTSATKSRRAKLFLEKVCAKYGISKGEAKADTVTIPTMTRDELLANGEIKVLYRLA